MLDDLSSALFNIGYGKLMNENLINSKKDRKRIDQLLVDRGFTSSREKARALILAREVMVEGEVILRAAAPVQVDAKISLKDQRQFVSRGGEKLAGALGISKIDVEGKICLDIGASTGGFTDCLLQYGASYVTAVDVGYGQIAEKLRNDERVNIQERTNARYLGPINPLAMILTMDVSFISVIKILPAVLQSLTLGADILILVKPQFEAGRKEIASGGVVYDSRIHAITVAQVAKWSINKGMRVRSVIKSPLKGPAGNSEFFLWLRYMDVCKDEKI